QVLPFAAGGRHRAGPGAGNRARPQRPSRSKAGAPGNRSGWSPHRRRPRPVHRACEHRHAQRGRRAPVRAGQPVHLLLDTHVALWAIVDNPELSTQAREWIAAPRNTVWISAASVWEIAIKHSLGRGDMPVSAKDALDYFRKAGYQMLPIEPEHAAAVEALPMHHQDPFDRLLVAQAQTEPMRLLTRDAQILRYGELAVQV